MANSFCISGEIGLSDKWSQKGGFKTIGNFKPLALKVIAVVCESCVVAYEEVHITVISLKKKIGIFEKWSIGVVAGSSTLLQFERHTIYKFFNFLTRQGKPIVINITTGKNLNH